MMCSTFLYFLDKLSSKLIIEGLNIVAVNKIIFLSLILDNRSFISESTNDHSASTPFFKGVFKRAESYNDKTDA
ncbi:MAG: Uncharacterised protein [Cryomorphaceae bacterium]|nr:MAG: Uncharacterised protein [Cryomorphaceae bacterium]